MSAFESALAQQLDSAHWTDQEGARSYHAAGRDGVTSFVDRWIGEKIGVRYQYAHAPLGCSYSTQAVVAVAQVAVDCNSPAMEAAIV